MFYGLMVIPKQNIGNFQPKEMETMSVGYTGGFGCHFGFPTESSRLLSKSLESRSSLQSLKSSGLWCAKSEAF